MTHIETKEKTNIEIFHWRKKTSSFRESYIFDSIIIVQNLCTLFVTVSLQSYL